MQQTTRTLLDISLTETRDNISTRYHTYQKGNIYVLTYQQTSKYHPEIRNINDYTATNKNL